jgi:hypothetical protein
MRREKDVSCFPAVCMLGKHCTSELHPKSFLRKEYIVICKVISYLFFFLAVSGFELKALHLLDRHSTT